VPFPMKIQPIDFSSPVESKRSEPVPLKPAAKWRFKRLFERQFPSVLKTSVPEKGTGGKELQLQCNKDGGSDEFEPSSVCLDKMVENFMEESNDKPSAIGRCDRHRCNCFNGNCNESSDDEMDSFSCFGESNHSSSADTCDFLKSLVPCASVTERNLLADTAKLVEKNKISKRKDDFCRKTVADGLICLGYDASVCNSRWEKSASYPAGGHEYVDVIVEGERLIIDVEFRSEFEIARSTKAYKAVLQTLPLIFVGKADRLQRIVHVVSDAAKQSLKKKGMPVPPWRKADYVKAKWLSPHTRIKPSLTETDPKPDIEEPMTGKKSFSGKTDGDAPMFRMPDGSDGEEEKTAAKKGWEPPELKPKGSQAGVKMVTGLASIIKDA
ncbi:hypothetical protein RJ640_019673, partial [Escallonia rubra]